MIRLIESNNTDNYFEVELDTSYNQVDIHEASAVFIYYISSSYDPDRETYVEVSEFEATDFDEAGLQIEVIVESSLIPEGSLENLLNIDKFYSTKEELERDINIAFKEIIDKYFNPGSDEEYFKVSEDTDYVQKTPDDAIAVYTYYVSNPYGDGDGYVKVSEFEESPSGEPAGYQIDEIVDSPHAPSRSLNRLVGTDKFYMSLEDLEDNLYSAFKEYVRRYL